MLTTLKLISTLLTAVFVFVPYASPPAWVGSLAQSSITTISLNNPAAVMPSALASEVDGWNASYSGFAFAPDYSTHGAMIGFGGGGYVADIFCAAAFDLATRLWAPMWTEIPPLTWADGSEYSHVQANMPGDAIVWSGSTSQAAAEDPWYFKPQGTSQWDDSPLLWFYVTNRLFRKGQTATNIPMSAHEYNCGLGIPAGILGLGEYGGLLLGMRTFATKNQGHCSLFPFLLDLKRGSAAPANRAAWRILSEIPKPPGGNDNENKLFGNMCWGMTTSFDAVRKRALLSWAGGGSGRATVSIGMSGDSGTEAYSFLGDNNLADAWPTALGRLMGSSDVRVMIIPGNSAVTVACVNLNPAVSSSARRIVPITNIAGTAPAISGSSACFDWVENAYSGEGAFAVPKDKSLWWLKPPVNRSAWATGQWTWEREDLTGVVSVTAGNENWGRFYWAPKCGVGIWCGNSSLGVQALRSSKVDLGTSSVIAVAKAVKKLPVSPKLFSKESVIHFNQSVISAAVYDVRGVCVTHLSVDVGPCIWNVEKANPGVYLVVAKTKTGEITHDRMTLIK